MKELLIGQDEQPSNNPQDCTTIEAPKATSVMEAVRMACASLGIDHDVAECIAAGTEARMQPVVSFQDVEAVIHSALSGVHFVRDLYVHPDSCWPDKGANLAQAQEAAAAVIAEYGGSVETRYFEEGKCDALGEVRVVTHGMDICIFFHSEEVPPCSAS